MTVDISLVICTRNRRASLARCLEAVSKLEFAGAWELVLVDNGSTDGTGDLIDEFCRQTEIQVVKATETIPGLGRARNVGIRHSRGTVLCFTDDDCYPQVDFLAQAHQTFARTELGFAGGRILLFDPTDAAVSIQERGDYLEFPARGVIQPGEIQGANMVFRAEALRDIGGFDPSLGSGTPFAAEDIDAVARASLSGWSGCYNPAMVVFHHHGRKQEDAVRLRRSYAVARGAFHMKMLVELRALDWFLHGERMLMRLGLRSPSLASWEIRGQCQYLGWWLKEAGPFRRNGRQQW